MSAELKGTIVSLVLTVGSYFVPGGRVLTVPFAFVLILVVLYWYARVQVDREERAEQEES